MTTSVLPLNDNQTALVSMRCDEAKEGTQGSTRYPCDVCLHDVWIAPSSAPFIKTARVLCLACFLERAPAGDA